MPNTLLTASAAALLLLPLSILGLSGLSNATEAPVAPAEVVEAVENTQATGWQRGNYWAYELTFKSGRTRDIAIVVHEATADGFRLGSNVSSGFFGLPFAGNVTRDLNPEIGGEVWPMFEFPLSDGMRWSYTMLGYEAETVARAALVHAPGIGEHPGFRLEAVSYGQVFARYEYSPVVGWLTSFELIEPTTRQHVLHAKLLHHGPEYGRGYFVETPITQIRIEYPVDAPGFVLVDVPQGVDQLRATLVARTSIGAVDARLDDERGRAILNATAVGAAFATDQAKLRAGDTRWTLRHAGAGPGVIVLDITGLVEIDPDEAARAARSGEGSALQSTLPALPHTGHVTSTL